MALALPLAALTRPPSESKIYYRRPARSLWQIRTFEILASLGYHCAVGAGHFVAAIAVDSISKEILDSKCVLVFSRRKTLEPEMVRPRMLSIPTRGLPVHIRSRLHTRGPVSPSPADHQRNA